MPSISSSFRFGAMVDHAGSRQDSRVRASCSVLSGRLSPATLTPNGRASQLVFFSGDRSLLTTGNGPYKSILLQYVSSQFLSFSPFTLFLSPFLRLFAVLTGFFLTRPRGCPPKCLLLPDSSSIAMAIQRLLSPMQTLRSRLFRA